MDQLTDQAVLRVISNITLIMQSTTLSDIKINRDFIVGIGISHMPKCVCSLKNISIGCLVVSTTSAKHYWKVCFECSAAFGQHIERLRRLSRVNNSVVLQQITIPNARSHNEKRKCVVCDEQRSPAFVFANDISACQSCVEQAMIKRHYNHYIAFTNWCRDTSFVHDLRFTICDLFIRVILRPLRDR